MDNALKDVSFFEGFLMGKRMCEKKYSVLSAFHWSTIKESRKKLSKKKKRKKIMNQQHHAY